MRKKAFITGINGQDGSYLAELLLKKIIKFMAQLGNQAPLILRGLIILLIAIIIIEIFIYIILI